MASNLRPAPDQVLVDIAEYVCNYDVQDERTFDTARLCLNDALACAIAALDFEECAKLLGPVVPGTIVPHGARIPGTAYELDPDTAAFNFCCMIRWLDYNDSFTASTTSHPSDNLGGILPLADHLSRQRVAAGKEPLAMQDVLRYLIKAYEIQGCLAIENAFAETTYTDHNFLIRVASSAVLTHMLGGSKDQIVNAVSNAFIDTSLTVYRHTPNTGWRKSWATAAACGEAMRLARWCVKGEMGYPSVLTQKGEGFYDARFGGKSIEFQRPYGEYIINNCSFKFVPAGMHGQTAAECAFKLHPVVKDRLEEIERIEVRCVHHLMRVMNKVGPLNNPADRVKCAQYNIAVGLITGKLRAVDYENAFAADPRIDKLRDRMILTEDKSFTKDFNDPLKRSDCNAIKIWFKDGSCTSEVTIEYPAGHARRRADILPIIRSKLEQSLERRFSKPQRNQILKLSDDAAALYRTPVNKFVEMLIP